jgi:uncharacterized protein (TIGR02611 family)
MQPLRRIGETRERHIASFASTYLDDGEEIVHWARVREPWGRRNGFAYLTERRWVVRWMGRGDDGASVLIREIRSWGVDSEASGGPILGVEGGDGREFVQLRVSSRGGVQQAAEFLRRFSQLAPRPRHVLEKGGHRGSFSPASDAPLSRQRRSLASHTKRFVVTVIGLGLVALGVLLLVLPGPGILVVIAGMAVLASEFDWAQDALTWLKQKYQETVEKVRERRARDRG